MQLSGSAQMQDVLRRKESSWGIRYAFYLS
jgi:hypothetical protein